MLEVYEKGDSSYVDLLLQARSLSELLNKAEYIGKISEYDREKLDEYIATKAQIAETKVVLETEHEELLDLQEQTEAKHASVDKSSLNMAVTRSHLSTQQLEALLRHLKLYQN